MQDSLLQQEKVKSKILLHSQDRLLWLQESSVLVTDQETSDIAAVSFFIFKLFSKEETCTFFFFCFCSVNGNYFFSSFGWTVLDILVLESDGTSNTAGYHLSFKEIKGFSIDHALVMLHGPLHPSGPGSYGE